MLNELRKPEIKIKRIYDTLSRSDGYRVLVDRLWPRGMTKAKAGIDMGLKDIAPSDELRKWFNHEPHKWADFQKRYFVELEQKQSMLGSVIEKLKGGVTLLYSAKDRYHNNSVVLNPNLSLDLLHVETSSANTLPRSCGSSRSHSASELLLTQKTKLPCLVRVCLRKSDIPPNDKSGLKEYLEKKWGMNNDKSVD